MPSLLFAAERWQTYTDDLERTYRAQTAPGATTLVAIDKGVVAGRYSSSLTAKSRLTFPLSSPAPSGATRTRAGTGAKALARAGGLCIHVLSCSGSYYLSLGAESAPGSRLHKETMA